MSDIKPERFSKQPEKVSQSGQCGRDLIPNIWISQFNWQKSGECENGDVYANVDHAHFFFFNKSAENYAGMRKDINLIY